MLKEYYYKVTQSTNNIYRISSDEGVCIDLFVGTKQALLLDTGIGLGDLRKTINSITQLPLIIVNTHGHYDHSNGNFQFWDCPIYMNEKDWEVYDYYSTAQNRRIIVNSCKAKKAGWNSDDIINILPDDFDEDAYIYANPVQLLPLRENMIFDLGGIVLKVIEVPGHTKGSCALLHEQTRQLYIGDAANSHIVLCIFNAPVSEYIHTLHKLKQLPFDRMLCSHETRWLDKSVLDAYLDCIVNPDPENFITASSPARPAEKDYMYIRHGYTPKDVQKSGFASFIVKEKI